VRAWPSSGPTPGPSRTLHEGRNLPSHGVTKASLRPLVWLLLITPDAESLVGRWRAEHDYAARFGIPAHVTVRTPFLPPERWRDPAFSLLARFLPTDLTLARLENRPGGLVIIVEPDDELRDITRAVTMSWPALPPHKGNRPDLAYHMTVVRTANDRIRSEAAEALAPRLPLRVTGTEMWATAGSLKDGQRHAVVARMQPGPAD
jgi:2'-5' RNA ligase superfamily